MALKWAVHVCMHCANNLFAFSQTRARRRGFVYFEGETLLKGKDDFEIVTLLEMPPKPWE